MVQFQQRQRIHPILSRWKIGCLARIVQSRCKISVWPGVPSQSIHTKCERMHEPSHQRNKAVKVWEKTLTLLEYVESIQNQEKRQQDEQFLAVIGRGE